MEHYRQAKARKDRIRNKEMKDKYEMKETLRRIK
jgi:hypothetical protein